MTPEQIKARSQKLYSFIIRERRMRERVFPPGHKSRDAKLADCDAAIEALRELKLFCDLHTEEPPEQVTLFDGEQLPAPGRRGGY